MVSHALTTDVIEQFVQFRDAPPDRTRHNRLRRNHANAKLESTAGETDHEQNALAVDGLARGRHRRVCSDEVDDGVVLEALGERSDRVMRAEFERGGEFVVGEVEYGDFSVRELCQELHGKLAKPAGADDEGASTFVLKVRKRALDGTKRGEPSAGERCRLHWVEITNRDEVLATGDEHVLRVSTVVDHTGFVRVSANHLVARSALAAVGLAAAPRGINENAAELGMLADDLVPEHDGGGPTEVPVSDVNVTVAHTTGHHANDLLTGARDRNLALLCHE